MATFSLKIETDNAAFENDTGREIARILWKLARYIENEPLRGLDHNSGKLHDINGNTVGEWRYEEEDYVDGHTQKAGFFQRNVGSRKSRAASL